MRKEVILQERGPWDTLCVSVYVCTCVRVRASKGGGRVGSRQETKDAFHGHIF